MVYTTNGGILINKGDIMLKYGIFLGRFQPFHKGHQYVVEQILKDGLTPIIIKGSAQEYGTRKNPFHPLECIHMINLVYPNIKVYTLDDTDNWDSWLDKLLKVIGECITNNIHEVAVYVHNKPEDLQDFTLKGVPYVKEYYSKVFNVCNLHTVNLPLSSVPIRASTIRDSLESNKQFLHPAVYAYIKNRG